MPIHAEKRVLPYTPAQLFDLVADVERYPAFLPWCVAVRVRRRETAESADGDDKLLVADMVIGFKWLTPCSRNSDWRETISLAILRMVSCR